MSEIVQLRHRVHNLVDRFGAVHTAIESIFATKTMFTEAFAVASDHAYHENYSYREGYENDDPPDHMSMVGQEVLIVSTDFFFPLVNDPTQASNLVYSVESIRRLSQAMLGGTQSHPVTLGPPSEENWLPDEIETVKRSYRRRITDATEKLRDINTTAKNLCESEARLPGFVRSALTGMFGVSDHNFGFEYTEIDFKRQPYGQNPKIMTARWLAPFIGLEKAKLVEDAMTAIVNVSNPLPGEPPTLKSFGSHVTNRINLFGGKPE